MLYRQRRLRHECKYLINDGVRALLSARFSAVMKRDIHTVGIDYRITSLYFDDIYRSAYNDKALGSAQRKKFRIRVYNLSAERIALEMKCKDDDFVSKKSALLSLDEYRQMLSGDYSFAIDERFSDTVMEDFLVSDAVSRLRPAVVVDYFREAFVNIAGNVRFTFDKRLSTCLNTLDMLSDKAEFTPVLRDTVLELKYDDFLPSYVGEVLSGAPLGRESVSKFILCTDKMLELKHYCSAQL